MLVFPSGLDLSSSHMRHLAAHRTAIGSRWRRLRVGRQVLLVLAYLRNGRPPMPSSRPKSVSAPPLTATSPKPSTSRLDRPTSAGGSSGNLDEGIRPAGRYPPADRPDRRRPAPLLRQAHEARHERAGHRTPTGPPAVGLTALPGAVREIQEAREHGTLNALADPGVPRWADRGYRGAGGTVHIVYWGRSKMLSTGQQTVYRTHAKIRVLVKQAVITLKSWRLLRKLRSSTTRIGSLVRAVLTLHLTSSN